MFKKLLFSISIIGVCYYSVNAQSATYDKPTWLSSSKIGIGTSSFTPNAPLHFSTTNNTSSLRISTTGNMDGRISWISYNDFDIICKVENTGGEGPSPIPILKFTNKKTLSKTITNFDSLSMGEVSINGFTARGFYLNTQASTFIPSSSGMNSYPFGISLTGANMLIGQYSTVAGAKGIVLNSDGVIVNGLNVGNSTTPNRVKIMAPASTGAKGLEDGGLTIWQATDKIMHVDGNDIWSEDALYLNDYSDKNVVICPKGGGNVGIGTDNTRGYKLAVNGAMICTKIVAKPVGQWPDFVFAKQHRLATLAEVEQYIKTHGHLQDMPTATEVAEQGVDLGEMNRLLLQKVEELTLQLIELNNTVEQLKKKR